MCSFIDIYNKNSDLSDASNQENLNGLDNLLLSLSTVIMHCKEMIS